MECTKEIVAFGMNSVEFHTLCVVGFVVSVVWLGCSLVRYLNQDIGKDRKLNK